MRHPQQETLPVPALDSPYRLGDEDVASFRRNGFVHLRGVATPSELEALGPSIEATALAQNLQKQPLDQRDTYGRAFLQVINLWLSDARVQAFVFARRFARIAAELLGVPGVRLYHDQALFKEPYGGHTPWHQDQYYWPLDTDDTVTLWMPLSRVPDEIGGMRFAAGSHRLGHLGDFAIGDQSHEVFSTLIQERGLAVESVGRLEAGDATFHHGWTLHSAGANPTNSMRPVMTVIYFKDGARLSPLDHPARRADAAMYLPGCLPGEIAESEYCPRLYPRDPGPVPPAPVRSEEYWARVFKALEGIRSERRDDRE
ncbi:MAG: phytanoyl-CoA dioxygenase family protein [Myxococcota bacterium]|nr:phytanoyl-CoA dioxygenase family protein [Myxococcota bacterium]